jgi:uncharacterized protein (DUF111 family)
MCLDALINAGLDAAFIEQLPKTLGIDGVAAHVAKMKRNEIACDEVDFRTIWGLEKLGLEHVYCGTLPRGDGFVQTAQGQMAVPTAATLRLKC